jgi:hypothetical protein
MVKSDLLEEKFMFGHFWFAVNMSQKVKVKEIFEKHNKEIGWRFSEKNERNESGDRLVFLELTNSEESLSNLNEKMDLFLGLIQDIYGSNVFSMSEEVAEAYSQGTINVLTGDQLNEDFKLKNINPKGSYYLRQVWNNHLVIIGDINKIIEAEKTYPKVIETIYGELVQRWYEESVEDLKKIFIDKDRFEHAKSVVERLEKVNVRKIPYNLKKFRFHYL